MSIEQVGPWLLLITGVVLLGCFAKIAFQEQAAKATLILLFVGGFACTGTGIYGPSFMNDYGDWMQLLFRVTDHQDAQAYNELVSLMGEGSIPPEGYGIVSSVLMENAPKGVDPKKKLSQAIAAAPAGEGRKALQAVHLNIERREVAMTTLLAAMQPSTKSQGTRTKVSEATLAGLDSVSRRVVSTKLINMAPQELKKIQVDPKVMSRIRAVEAESLQAR